MRKIVFLMIIGLIAAMCGCEKIIVEEKEEDEQEQTTDLRDDDGDGYYDDGDGYDEGDDDEWEEDTTKTYDRSTEYVEKDFTVEEGDDTGGFHTGDEITVSQFINNEIRCGVWVTGYIVAACTTSANKEDNVDFTPPFKFSSAVLIADKPDENNVSRCASIQLKSGSAIRNTLDPETHPEIKGKRLKVFGYKTTYLGIPGIKDILSGNFMLLD